jgi:hypothetical protein
MVAVMGIPIEGILLRQDQQVLQYHQIQYRGRYQIFANLLSELDRGGNR